MHWFGSAWPSEHVRAPVCEDDAMRIPTPVGLPCMWCDELIEEDDRGEDIVMVVSDGDAGVIAKTAYMHIECSFRQVMGGPAHIRGECMCSGGDKDPDDGMTPHEAARYVWEHWAGYAI
jgi:hypothetical protein